MKGIKFTSSLLFVLGMLCLGGTVVYGAESSSETEKHSSSSVVMNSESNSTETTTSEKESSTESKTSTTTSETTTSNTKSSDSSTTTSTSESTAPVVKPEAAANITYVRTYTTEQFIQLIGEDARRIAWDNDLYASVMIAQAILESASGSSSLAREPNFNLFGIKGSYNGNSVSMSTQEDKGNGEMYSIVSPFRKYANYSESMQDYADLLKGKELYKGALKSTAKTYEDATEHLKGRYATDSVYNVKLNKLIETYDLTKYDKERKAVTEFTYVVGENDSLSEIAQRFSVSVERILEDNQLSNNFLSVGQEILIKFDKDHKVVYEDEVESKKGMKIHIVSSDDSLQTIADRYQTTVTKIVETNKLSGNFLKEGQRIYIY